MNCILSLETTLSILPFLLFEPQCQMSGVPTVVFSYFVALRYRAPGSLCAAVLGTLLLSDARAPSALPQWDHHAPLTVISGSDIKHKQSCVSSLKQSIGSNAAYSFS